MEKSSHEHKITDSNHNQSISESSLQVNCLQLGLCLCRVVVEGNMSKRQRLDSGKIFSRNALYTPLEAYKQDKVDPDVYLSTKTAIPKSLHQSGLIRLLTNTSHKLHRQYFSIKDGKNGGSKPLTITDVEGRVHQRGVTLIGGGITSSKRITKPAPNHPHSVTSKKRGRKTRSRVDGIIKQVSSDNNAKENIQFLRDLNVRWNQYALEVLKLEHFRTMFDQMDLSGAHVRIASCKEMKHLVGKQGVVVGSTKNLWIVAMVKGERKNNMPQKASTTRNETAKGTASPASQKLPTLHLRLEKIPKRNSQLTVMILDDASSRSSSLQVSGNDDSCCLIPPAKRDKDIICIELEEGS